MAISFEILGTPGRDNALFVRIDSGQSVDRLLFDCGDCCLNSVSYAEIHAIDHLFFSHLHMDHVGDSIISFGVYSIAKARRTKFGALLAQPVFFITGFRVFFGTFTGK